MTNSKIKLGGGKVIPFEQTGDFFYKRGLDKLDKNNLLGAMAYYNKALERDPQNTEIRLAIAETLTEMYRFEESNRLLFTTFRDVENRPSECYFGMGMNFLGLKEYERARESLEQYTFIEPEGEFAYDAYDILDALEESFEEDENSGRNAQTAQLAKDLLDHDDFAGAIRILEELVKQSPDDLDARNNLALAYYCNRDFQSATEQMHCILEEQPNNLQAHCNLAVFLHGAKDDAAAQTECDYIAAADTEDPEELSRIGLALMELARFSDAYAVHKRLLRIVPYDRNTLHRLGQCAYQLGEYQRAAEYYDRLVKVDARDSIARFYRNDCLKPLSGSAKRNTVMLSYQVPLDETVARIHKLNHYLGMDAAARKAIWQRSGSELELLLNWGTQLAERSVKRAMLRLAASFEDEKAELLLRDFLLQRTQPGDLKREVFGLLKHMGAQEPYLGYMDGELVESKVSLIKLLDEAVPDMYSDVLDICMGNMQDRPQRFMMEAANAWSDYIASLDGFPAISTPQTYAFAAALEYLACREGGQRATKGELCKKYGVTLVRFNHALSKLMDIRQGEKKD